ncbi:helix-turn-helix domain-containing protein [Halostella salina]|uniref:helix-turn-helix domain-containing protein n=1 Tax=Halostella salina TaxID=1547897 RepID=UPI000EF7CBBC|nr:helix-turn-helix domain-containing protein [Halostella salina]
MTTITEYTLPADEFPLGRIFKNRPDATLELDRVVPTDDTVMPFFWVMDEGGDMAELRTTLADLPELRTAELLSDMGARALFRAEWQPDHVGIMGAIGATGVTVLSASGSSAGWAFELRADTSGQLSAFQQHCEDHDIPVTLTRLGEVTKAGTGRDYGLTPDQREALVLAFEEGYYENPRKVNQERLAAKLGISRQALAARLRRGYRNLVGSTLRAGDPTDGS